jgi:hypothetical protein
MAAELGSAVWECVQRHCILRLFNERGYYDSYCGLIDTNTYLPGMVTI